MALDAPIPKINQAQFDRLCNWLYDFCGINMNDSKRELVQSRLSKRMISLKIRDFDEYFKKTEKDPIEFSHMVDSLTTNKTSFFRENQHFDFLREHALPSFKEKKLRIWSAACSTGEEPYTIGMVLAETLPNYRSWDIKILATDISSQVLQKAVDGIYSEESMAPVASQLRQKYFSKQPNGRFKISKEIQSTVKFARLNFMDPFPMKGPFDIIFCRNAMIYFDKKTQEKLVQKFSSLLAPGGYLLIGHSESLSGFDIGLKYLQPATYQK